MKRAWLSFSSIFGVVPDAMRAWKPDTEPQAMVMKRNGNRLPAHTGPVPSMNLVTAGIFKSGWTLSLIHISEPTRLGMISYAVFCLKKKQKQRSKKRIQN